MKRRILAVPAVLVLLVGAAFVSLAADERSSRAEEADVGKESELAHERRAKERPANESPAKSSQKSCSSYCDAAETQCSTEVRRARAQCSKNAASGGRNPYTGRNDYAYFCRHFDIASRDCGAGSHSGNCQTRLQQRYGLCVDAMNNNTAAMRYDCFKSERDAQSFCREELRDCKAACK